MTVSLPENIDWVGCVDWTVRDFHGYDATRGTTYNAYLVRDERTALIDAVKAPYAEQLLANVAAPLRPGPGRLRRLQSCRARPPGALPQVMRRSAGPRWSATPAAAPPWPSTTTLAGWKVQVVADGDTLALGRRTLRFIETPMVHWPESMFTYVPEEKLLFSMDVFGQHYATAERFDEEVPGDVLFDEAKTYYANILMPYGAAVGKCLAKLADAGDRR